MRSSNSRIPCALSNVTTYLRRYLLSCQESRLGFVTLCIGEVSLGPLGNTHHKKLASKVTKELVTRWCITEWVKRLAINKIELGIDIPRIESRESNISTDKGNYICCHKVRLIKVFVEYVGANMATRFRYWLLTGEVSQSFLHSSRTHRVRTLNVRWRYSVIWVICFGGRMLFGVPDEITDMTRSSGMVRR